MYCSSASATAHNYATMQPIPATIDQLKPGVRVRCILKGNYFYSKSATVHRFVNNILYVVWDLNVQEVREWGLYEEDFTLIQDQPAITSSNGTINNHICPTCGNNRCNSEEKACWKCGNLL